MPAAGAIVSVIPTNIDSFCHKIPGIVRRYRCLCGYNVCVDFTIRPFTRDAAAVPNAEHMKLQMYIF